MAGDTNRQRHALHGRNESHSCRRNRGVDHRRSGDESYHHVWSGAGPLNQIPPSANVTVDPDGARHAFISSISDVVHSGFITEAPQDRIGLAQAPLSATRFRLTFTRPGIYPYICVLHDGVGMVGEIVVLP